MIVDHTNRRVLDVLESREKAAVVKFLRESQASGLLANVTEVTTDMWDGYVEAAREVFGPSVTLTIDRFHVMKNLQDRLAAARREIQRELPESEARELKGSRWLWLTNPENLKADQLQRLTELKSQFPRLAQLADQREALRQLFDDRSLTTAAAGSDRLSEWLTAARAGPLRPEQVLRHPPALARQDRELFRLPLQQRPHRGLQQRPPHPPPPNLRYAQLPPLPPASPRPLRKNSTTRINMSGGEPEM